MRVKTLMKIIITATVCITSSGVLSAQTYGMKYVPYDSSAIGLSFGAGLGVPYGVFGVKVSASTSLLTGELGLGLMPLIWDPAISLGGIIHFRDHTATVRPKFTVTYSNIVSGYMILNEVNFESLSDETFDGFCIYGGIDWRPLMTSSFCIDFNIGWVFPFVGMDEVEKRYDNALSDLRQQGFVITEETGSLKKPVISIGITFSPWRKLKEVPVDK